MPRDEDLISANKFEIRIFDCGSEVPDQFPCVLMCFSLEQVTSYEAVLTLALLQVLHGLRSP